MVGIYAVGVDIIEVERIKGAIKKYPGFIERIYTEGEVKYCESKGKTRYLHYAARFAAKEACAKSLAQGMGKNIFFKEIELNNEDSGAPYIKLYGKTCSYSKKLRVKEIKISISTTDRYAVAFAISIL